MRKPRTRPAAPCRHCGTKINKSSLARHERACLHDPSVLERVRQFLVETAEDGCIVHDQTYRLLCGEAGLPNANALRKHFGSWGRLATWAGLGYRKHRGPSLNPTKAQGKLSPEIDAPTEPIGRDGEQEAEYEMFEGMRGKAGTLVRPKWLIDAKKYVPGYAETGWVRLY